MLHKDKTIVKHRKITNKNKRMSDEETFYDGKCMIYRTTGSGDVWQFRMYADGEQRYVRQSLKTRNLIEARQKAEKLFIEYSSRIHQGEFLFSIKMEEFTKKYLEYQYERVEAGMLSKGRYNNIRTFTKTFMEFIGADTKVGNIKNDKMEDYRAWRQKRKSDITMTVVVNELITIRQMFNWGKKKGIVSRNYDMDWGEIKVNKNEVRREGYDPEEYKILSRYASRWHTRVSDFEDKKEEVEYFRKSIRDFIGIMANYGMRTGECLQLKWKDIKVNEKTDVAQINIRAETSKINQSRENTGKRADIFIRRKLYSKFISDDDFVFSDFNKRRMMSKDRLYRYYNHLCDEIEKNEDNWKRKDLYGIRHMFISMHILLGKVDVYTIARWAGTSLVQIQNHYDNVKDKQVSNKMRYDFTWDDIKEASGFDESDDLKESEQYI